MAVGNPTSNLITPTYAATSGIDILDHNTVDGLQITATAGKGITQNIPNIRRRATTRIGMNKRRTNNIKVGAIDNSNSLDAVRFGSTANTGYADVFITGE